MRFSQNDVLIVYTITFLTDLLEIFTDYSQIHNLEKYVGFLRYIENFFAWKILPKILLFLSNIYHFFKNKYFENIGM